MKAKRNSIEELFILIGWFCVFWLSYIFMSTGLVLTIISVFSFFMKTGLRLNGELVNTFMDSSICLVGSVVAFSVGYYANKWRLKHKRGNNSKCVRRSSCSKLESN